MTDCIYINQNESPNGINALSYNNSGFTQIGTYSISANGNSTLAGGINCSIISADGNYLFVSTLSPTSDGIITSFSVNQTTGVLTFINNYNSHGEMVSGGSLSVSSNGLFLFALNRRSSTVSVFNIGIGGTLSLASGSPFSLPTGAVPNDLVVTSDSNYLIITLQGILASEIAVLNIGNNGVLTMPNSPISTGLLNGAFSICITNNNYVFVASATGIITYSFNTGILTYLSSVIGLVNVLNLTISNNDQYLFSTGTLVAAQIVTSYTIGTNGVLTSLDSLSLNISLSTSYLLALNGNQNVLYVVATGTLSTTSTISAINLSGGSFLSQSSAMNVSSQPVSGISVFSIVPVPCFLEGTKILCLYEGNEMYIPVERLNNGILVKTLGHNYLPVTAIGTRKIRHNSDNHRHLNKLYRCTKNLYPDLFDDLVITGGHSILVDYLTDVQRKRMVEIFVTDNKYRLMAYVDERAKIYENEGVFNIWHIAVGFERLSNHGIYANGLLVESCFRDEILNHLELKIPTTTMNLNSISILESK